MRRLLNRIVLFGLLASASIFTLTGCGPLNNYVSEKIIAESEKKINNTEEYQKYKEYLSEGLLTEDGMYPEPSQNLAETDEADSKAVELSIATNSFLNCIYYTDEQTKTPITSNLIYLDPGESLFVANVLVNNDISNLYDFSCFRIWGYDKKGNRSKKPYDEVTNKSGLLLKIPEDFEGAGFSIEPVGVYTKRQLTARAYYVNNGEEKDLPNGQWKVNKKPFGKSVEISPVESYTLVYDYTAYKDDFYFMESTPSAWYSNENEHSVTFREVSSNEQETEFAVKMHSFVTMSVKNSCLSWASGIPIIGDHGKGIIQSIKKGSEPLGQDHTQDKSFEINKLKVGDTVSIRVGKEFKINGVGVNVGTPVPLGSNAENGYEYTIIVPDTNKGISVEITERSSNAEGVFQGYSVENADVTIKRANGTQLKIGEELPGDNEKVTIIITPHEGYYINGFNKKDTYSFEDKGVKFSKLEKEITSILDKHSPIKFISLNLVFSDETGTYTYKLDGDKVTDSPLLNVRVGQKLDVVFTANEGYSITKGNIVSEAWSNLRSRVGAEDSASESIKVTPDMDGKTVDKDTFGITVEKEG